MCAGCGERHIFATPGSGGGEGRTSTNYASNDNEFPDILTA